MYMDSYCIFSTGPSTCYHGISLWPHLGQPPLPTSHVRYCQNQLIYSYNSCKFVIPVLLMSFSE